MQLIVSLPRNDLKLAEAAADAGADALKLHMNVEHRASGSVFGSFAAEREAVTEIIKAVDCPVGLMPGGTYEEQPSFEELSALAEAGLDFVDIYADQMPLWFLDLPLKLILALRSFDGLVEPAFFQTHYFYPPGAHRNRIYMCEASICPPQDYGKPFSYADLRMLRVLQEYIDCPLLVPTQKNVTPEDAVWLKRGGAGALMIGAIVAGTTAESIWEATSRYRKALDADMS